MQIGGCAPSRNSNDELEYTAEGCLSCDEGIKTQANLGCSCAALPLQGSLIERNCLVYPFSSEVKESRERVVRDVSRVCCFFASKMNQWAVFIAATLKIQIGAAKGGMSPSGTSTALHARKSLNEKRPLDPAKTEKIPCCFVAASLLHNAVFLMRSLLALLTGTPRASLAIE